MEMSELSNLLTSFNGETERRIHRPPPSFIFECVSEIRMISKQKDKDMAACVQVAWMGFPSWIIIIVTQMFLPLPRPSRCLDKGSSIEDVNKFFDIFYYPPPLSALWTDLNY